MDTRDRMLDAATTLLHRHGFHGTSLNAILDESGAPRGSLYHHFPGGKEQLVLEATRRGIEQVTATLEQMMASGAGPAAAVGAYVRASADELRDSGYVLGCPVAPLVLDLTGEASALAEICRQALITWQRILGDGLTAADVPAPRAATLATTIAAAVEGALMMARSARDTAPLEAVADELTRLIEGALPPA